MMGHFGKVTPRDALPFAEVYLTIPVVHFVFSAAGGAPLERSSYDAPLHLYHFAIPHLTLYLQYAAAGLVAVVEAAQAALEFSVAGVDTAPAAEFGIVPAAAVVALVQALVLALGGQHQALAARSGVKHLVPGALQRSVMVLVLGPGQEQMLALVAEGAEALARLPLV